MPVHAAAVRAAGPAEVDGADALTAGAWPARHGWDLPGARRMTRRLRWFMQRTLGQVDEPDAAAWQAMGEALMRGDPLADAVASWMLDTGVEQAWPVVMRCMSAGAAPWGAAPPALRAFLQATWCPPKDMDLEAAARGALALHATGFHGVMVLRDAALMAGYQASAINQTLLRTGALADGVASRVARTSAWWMAVTELDGMRPGAPGHLHTLRVRLMHALVRQRELRGGTWDAGRWGLPINQLDMQVTCLSFSVVHLVALMGTGVWLTAAQRADVMALWRLVGWHMGVEPALLCRTETEGRRALVHNLLSQAPADAGSRRLARALMDEPLQRHYVNLGWLRGRFNRARHLSLVRWFIGSEGMAALGLPPTTPWYPLVCMLPLALCNMAMALSPRCRRWLASWGRARQRNYLSVLAGQVAPAP